MKKINELKQSINDYIANRQNARIDIDQTVDGYSIYLTKVIDDNFQSVLELFSGSIYEVKKYLESAQALIDLVLMSGKFSIEKF